MWCIAEKKTEFSAEGKLSQTHDERYSYTSLDKITCQQDVLLVVGNVQQDGPERCDSCPWFVPHLCVGSGAVHGLMHELYQCCLLFFRAVTDVTDTGRKRHRSLQQQGRHDGERLLPEGDDKGGEQGPAGVDGGVVQGVDKDLV